MQFSLARSRFHLCMVDSHGIVCLLSLTDARFVSFDLVLFFFGSFFLAYHSICSMCYLAQVRQECTLNISQWSPPPPATMHSAKQITTSM